jgi:AcrR family transcriptional regulator
MGSAEPAQEPSKPLYRGLASGRGGLAPEEVARHQRARLIGAVIEAVSRHGYAGVTLRELVGLAGVSKSTFYELFKDKEECFLAAFDEIVAEAAALIGEARDVGGNPAGRLRAALGAAAELMAAMPAASSLVLVDSLSLGVAGAERREGAMVGIEEVLRESFAEGDAEAGEVSELAVRGIAGGLRRIAYRSLRDGRPELFAGHAEELVEWALGYARSDCGAKRSAPFAQAPSVAGPTRQADGGDEQEPGWDEPPSSAASRRALTQRERIARAVARLAAAKGYASLSVPAISGEAGVSNQTFYQEFAGKQEAFLEAFDTLAEEALEQAVPAFQAEGEWARAVGAGLGELLRFLATNPLFARLAFFELPAAGLIGLDHADGVSKRFTAFLGPAAIPAGTEAPPEAVVDAISGGIFTLIQHEVSHGRTVALPGLGPEIVFFALAPYGLG